MCANKQGSGRPGPPPPFGAMSPSPDGRPARAIPIPPSLALPAQKRSAADPGHRDVRAACTVC
eukprot:64665-Chlamydomonas_euryale.AAC.1